MFWLPYGLFPYYAEWLISFPRAPLGSVSIVSWQLACTGVIALVVDTIRALVKVVMDARSQAGQKAGAKRKEEPVKASSGSGGSNTALKKDS